MPQATPTEVPTLTSTPEPPTATVVRHSSLPDANAYTWQEIITGLVAPVGIVDPADGTERLFIIEQAGRILIWQQGSLLSRPFLDITDRVGTNGSERGLLGLAFHPQYAENGHLYVNYTDLQGNTVIARFNVSPDDPDLALPASELQLLRVNQPYANHNGGAVVFGPDGDLYLGLGDGGSAGDPEGNAQSLSTLLGKILRLDVDRGEPYVIPEENPYSAGDGLPEIWAYGLRNPWRITFDRLTGDLYIADVGQNRWEEINFLAAGSPGGSNFGWDYFEGSHPYDGSPPSQLNLIPPVAEYSHDLGCSVTGGVVYRGEALPEWQGVYLYGDYCSGNVWGLLRDAQDRWMNALLFGGLGRVSSFGQDQTGEVYLVDHAGRILLLVRK
jgi:glucose/arabinose dehydrogenase